MMPLLTATVAALGERTRQLPPQALDVDSCGPGWNDEAARHDRGADVLTAREASGWASATMVTEAYGHRGEHVASPRLRSSSPEASAVEELICRMPRPATAQSDLLL
ncbi:hypothetical protein AXA44_40005 [Rhodococcus sp. SC4]|nr:hypothetical protein AXA44_40005 [Rhodococcus sp. SC4]